MASFAFRFETEKKTTLDPEKLKRLHSLSKQNQQNVNYKPKDPAPPKPR